jgi:glutathione synthase/RimK-type ligase-like ATP-grasp enzyme
MIKPNLSGSFRVLALTAPKGLRHVKESFLKQENIRLDFANLNTVEAVLDEYETTIKVNGKSLTEYDFVWLQTKENTKDIAYLLSLQLDKMGIAHTRTDVEISKLVDMFNLASNNIAIPKTFFCNANEIMGSILNIQKELGYPYVIKPTIGLAGMDIHLIKNVVDLINTLPKLSKHKKYICQSFIPNDFDYRIIVGNGKVLSGLKSIRTTDLFRNSARLGAREEFMKVDEIPADITQLALEVCDTCNLAWTGLDIVKDKITGKNYILEMNRCPGLTKASTEIDAAMTYLKYLKDKVTEQEISMVEIETKMIM